jgi:hypothetical protein
VYHVIEQAKLRGLCDNLPEAKPYSRGTVFNCINEILSHDGSLNETERNILERYLKEFGPRETGRNLKQGSYYFELAKDKFRFTGNIALSLDTLVSGGFYPNRDESVWSTDNWITLSAGGDLGYNFSYGLSLSGGVLKIPRQTLGVYNTYYDGFLEDDPESQYQNQVISTYSEPLSFFPYSYQKKWDGFIFYYNDIGSGGLRPWPQETVSIGYGMLGELAGSFLSDRLSFRVGRLDREWASMSPGSSLVLNQAARPFVALEATFMPVSWFAFSTMTGILEYLYHDAGLKGTAATSQNAYSINLVELNYKNYFHLDFGTNAVWPKRFELGYLFPLFDNYLYQNNVGDFDNLALFFNIRGQYPRIGNIWFSLFFDEANIGEIGKLFELDRQMVILQLGASVVIPWLPFTSVKLSYTKNEPYNYTHTREYVPWYNRPMESNYVNNGVSLGYYLPPNADEILVRFESMPLIGTRVHLQYQLIRHGADFGSSAVDGSSLWSELDPSDRSSKDVLRKYFLHDGAYQWMHIIKLGGEYTLPISVPITLFAEAGVVYSYFTDIGAGLANTGKSYRYSIIDTSEYPRSTAIIVTLGFRLFSK